MRDIDEKYLAFLLARSGWANVPMNQNRGLVEATQRWIDTIGEPLSIMWRFEEILTWNELSWHDQLREWYIRRDIPLVCSVTIVILKLGRFMATILVARCG